MGLKEEREGLVKMQIVEVKGQKGFWEKKGFVVRDMKEIEEKMKRYQDNDI